jgi:hypothetical protein
LILVTLKEGSECNDTYLTIFKDENFTVSVTGSQELAVGRVLQASDGTTVVRVLSLSSQLVTRQSVDVNLVISATNSDFAVVNGQSNASGLELDGLLASDLAVTNDNDAVVSSNDSQTVGLLADGDTRRSTTNTNRATPLLVVQRGDLDGIVQSDSNQVAALNLHLHNRVGVLGASETLSLTVVNVPLDNVAFVVSSQQFVLSSIKSNGGGNFVVTLIMLQVNT